MASNTTTPRLKKKVKSLSSADGQVQRAISSIAESDCPVLLIGEHGVGKRTVAAQIHQQSNRARHSYREIHSADATERNLLTALASTGTVYLAEIGELSLSLQKKIVDNYFHAKGAARSRLLCGSTRELQEVVRSRRMREDFHFFISAVTLRVPPLRHRKEEILPLADELLTKYAHQLDRSKPVLRKDIVAFLMEHDWPNNLSELQSAMKTLVAVSDQSITLDILRAAAHKAKANGHHKSLSLKEATRAASLQIERQLISEVLVSTGGNRKRAADELGISYKTLLYKFKQIEVNNQPASNRHGVTQ